MPQTALVVVVIGLDRLGDNGELVMQAVVDIGISLFRLAHSGAEEAPVLPPPNSHFASHGTLLY